MVTVVPIVPDIGDKLVIEGAANAAMEKDRNNVEMTTSRKFFIEPPHNPANASAIRLSTTCEINYLIVDTSPSQLRRRWPETMSGRGPSRHRCEIPKSFPQCP